MLSIELFWGAARIGSGPNDGWSVQGALILGPGKMIIHGVFNPLLCERHACELLFQDWPSEVEFQKPEIKSHLKQTSFSETTYSNPLFVAGVRNDLQELPTHLSSAIFLTKNRLSTCMHACMHPCNNVCTNACLFRQMTGLGHTDHPCNSAPMVSDVSTWSGLLLRESLASNCHA